MAAVRGQSTRGRVRAPLGREPAQAGRGGLGVARGRGAPRGSAAASHERTAEYMENWESAYAAMSLEGGRAPQRIAAGRDQVAAATAVTAAPLPGPYRPNTPSLVAGYRTGPLEERGRLVDLSERPLVAMALRDEEVAVAGTDHGVYVVDINKGRVKRKLYTKTSGHTEWVTCVCFLPDGRVLSGGMDSKICLWLPGGARCVDLTGHFGSISCLGVDAMGKIGVSSSYDGTLIIWDLAKKKTSSTLKAHKGPVLGFSWGDTGAVLSGGRDGLAMLWDLNVGQRSRVLRGHAGHVTAQNWISETLVATGAQDGHVRIWDIRTETCSHNISAHTSEQGSGAVGDIQVAQGDQVVSMGADCTINVLDAAAGFAPRCVIGDHKDFIYSLRVIDGLILSGGGDGSLLVHDLSTGGSLYGLGANQHAVRCVDATATTLIAAGDDGNCLLYDFRS
mmetsp:Transcript_21104/g.50074  ORF Transcript_21104/g.50074 Transcript_21104/m.50074 type:complete len:448 (-) Transcript_21104:17-1360(-)